MFYTRMMKLPNTNNNNCELNLNRKRFKMVQFKTGRDGDCFWRSCVLLIGALCSGAHAEHKNIFRGVENLRDDFRFISHKDILMDADRFEATNVTTFSTLLFDVSREQLIVGARDVLYRMSFSLQPREISYWEASPEVMGMCQAKGQSESDCRNYIKVLQNYEDQLYACGTHAFNPSCSWRQMENLTVTKYDKGVGKCPFNPHANITTLMTGKGRLFVGSSTDFSGADSAILRIDLANDMKGMLRTKQYNLKWLNNPQFIGSFEAGEFIYFVFRETALEYINCGKVVYPRIARVCKSDPGGDHILKDNWTSFLKARLNCSLPGEYPFYFNEIQGITYSAETGILYATFTTPPNSIQGSAVCAYNISAINYAFSGPFKHQETIKSAWENVDTVFRDHFSCKAMSSNPKIRHNQVIESTRYQMVDRAIQPITLEPIYVSQLEIFKHISMDILTTKYHKDINILYVSTEDGLIKKISILPDTGKSCLIEIWQPEEDAKTKIHAIQFLKETESLYIGTEQSLFRISSQHCNRHVSRLSCLNSMDPYCGWDERKESCTSRPNRNDILALWLQNITQCPVLTAAIDGGWSSWSDWYRCEQNSDDNHQQFNENDSSQPHANVDSCLCRKKICNNPAPKNGGKECRGFDIQVTNCTVHGGWTEWSAWSACSSTCGVAVKTRRRTCGNPKPAHGGRICVGPDRSEIYCSHLPPCPVPKETPIDGGWGPWGAWSECSSQCGGGFKIRRRKCNDPEPQNGGLDCPGCHLEYEVCNTHPCTEVRKLSAWTPWLTDINSTLISSSNGETVEKRFRFSCKASVPDPSLLKMSLFKEEVRICKNDTCQRVTDISETDRSWSEWGPCSVSCGGGTQYRTKICENSSCEGKGRIARTCNTHPCSEWGCWTDWSTCSVSCGVGVQFRTRSCLSADGFCDGRDTEERECRMPDCEDGWSNWSEWSPCTDGGIQTRYRKCISINPLKGGCKGSDYDERRCPLSLNDIHLSAVSISLILSLTVVTCSGFSVLLTYFLLKRKLRNEKVTKRLNTSHPSPEMHSNANTYSSLPTKEESRQKPKRQPSFNSSSSKNFNSNPLNTLTKTNNNISKNTSKLSGKQYSDFEKGTMKRNSQALNNSRKYSNIGDDKF